MITPEDIKLLVASGEGYNAEFKVSVPAKVKELSEEICAFANAAGCVLLIGVNDANEIKGVEINNAKRSAIQNYIREITPALHCSVEIVRVDGKSIGVIETPSGLKNPYVLSGAIYVRIGPNTQKLTTAEQMRDFFQQSDRIYFDTIPNPGFDIYTEIDNGNFNDFRLEAKLNTSVSDKQILENLQLFDNGFIKRGGILFFAKKPEEQFFQAIVCCVLFKGITKVHIIDDKTFGGTLYRQYQQAMDWIESKLQVAYLIEGAGPRKEIWEIPLTVFKESTINALSHRDYYEQGAVITIEIFDDRVEISNCFMRPVNHSEEISEEISVKGSVKMTEKMTEKILRLIKENNTITIDELAGKTSKSNSTIERQLKKLKVIERIGADNGGYWQLIEL